MNVHPRRPFYHDKPSLLQAYAVNVVELLSSTAYKEKSSESIHLQEWYDPQTVPIEMRTDSDLGHPIPSTLVGLCWHKL